MVTPIYVTIPITRRRTTFTYRRCRCIKWLDRMLLDCEGWLHILAKTKSLELGPNYASILAAPNKDFTLQPLYWIMDELFSAY